MEHVREELDRLITQRGYGYASISRLLGRNPAYVQQFIKRGSPRKLDDEDRKTLACFFGVDEQVLGGPANPVTDGMVEIPVLDVEASAGFGAVAASEICTYPVWVRRTLAATPNFGEERQPVDRRR